MREPLAETGIRRAPLWAVVALGMSLGVSVSEPALGQSSYKIPKACAAARNRVAQQQKAVRDLDVRIEREERSRSLCGTQKACKRYDQRIESLERRKDEHLTQLSRLQAMELRACAPPGG